MGFTRVSVLKEAVRALSALLRVPHPLCDARSQRRIAKTGAFLAFIPEQDTNEIQTVEDGFFLYLTNSAWQKIREALLSGTDVFVPPARVGDASITVVWEASSVYESG